MKKMIVAIALMGLVGTANAAAEKMADGFHTASPVEGSFMALALGGFYLAATHEPCANSTAPVKYVKQDGANYLVSVAGCEAKYPK